MRTLMFPRHLLFYFTAVYDCNVQCTAILCNNNRCLFVGLVYYASETVSAVSHLWSMSKSPTLGYSTVTSACESGECTTNRAITNWL